jgi:hypothetical protein
MSMTQLAQAVACPQVFAEFPFHLEWRDVRQHMGRLSGATALHYNTGDEPYLTFAYRAHLFCIREHSGRLEFTAESCSGAEPIIAQVEAHFTALLAPDLI